MVTKERTYLSKARYAKDYSLRRTAMKAGMALQHYAKVESGQRGDRVSFMMMIRIAKALDLSLYYMATEEEKYQKEINKDYF